MIDSIVVFNHCMTPLYLVDQCLHFYGYLEDEVKVWATSTNDTIDIIDPQLVFYMLINPWILIIHFL